jgi:hypothetical protein
VLKVLKVLIFRTFPDFGGKITGKLAAKDGLISPSKLPNY